MYKYLNLKSHAQGISIQLAAFLFLLSIASAALPADYLPESDNEVIAKFSPTVVSIAARVRSSESATFQKPQASSLMREILAAYTLARQTNDAQAYGHTLSLLKMWPNTTEAPALILTIEAATLQHNHQFDAALEKLDSVLVKNPNNIQAYLIALQIHLVRGEYPKVEKTCNNLSTLGVSILALNCQSQLLGLTGRGNDALERLTSVLARQQIDAVQALELHTTAADIAHRLEINEMAVDHYRAALNIAPENSYLLVHYSDWLIEQRRFSEVTKLIEPIVQEANNFELKLQLYRALQAMGRTESRDNLLQEIHAEARAMKARGEDRPHKLIAFYELEITGNYSASLTEALVNWQEQKDPSDALLLAKAAKATGSLQSLNEVRAWKNLHNLEDYRLEALLADGSGQ
jgi:Tfp pilus assembly protein PilF